MTVTTDATYVLGPQSGPQEAFFRCPADILVGGGAAGGGKTWSLLAEPIRFVTSVKGFSAVCFRRTYPRITNEGGLWDESVRFYGMFEDAVAIPGKHLWVWPETSSTVRFAHLQHAWTVEEWKGAQVPVLLFDQLEEFEGSQFWYMLSRNRWSTGEVTPYMRATANPDPDSFVAELIGWWIDQETGYAIPDRSGKLRWFFRDQHDGELHWADRMEDLRKYLPRRLPPGIAPRDLIKSLSFIPSTVYDNKILLQNDPGYLGRLMNLPLVERERLLGGNWKVRHEAGKVFPRTWTYADPAWFEGQLRANNVVAMVRYWDKAATEELLAGPDWSWTVGVLMAFMSNGRYVVVDVVRGQWGIAERDRVMAETMNGDRVSYGVLCTQWWEREPGGSGKETAQSTATIAAHANVAGYYHLVTGSKLERAAPYAAAVQNGIVQLIRGSWNREYVEEHFRCPSKMMDQVDASAGAFSKLPKAAGEYDPKAWRTVA